MEYQGQDEDYEPDIEADDAPDAAEAFEDLRAEVAHLREAVEQVRGQLAAAPAPVDYSETLARLFQTQQALAKSMAAIGNSPVLSVEHAAVLRRVEETVDHIHRHGRAMWADAAKEMTGATGRITEAMAAARDATWRWRVAGALVMGALFWATWGGLVLRTAPAQLQWPEKAAARLMRMSMWDAGLKIAETGSPADFARVGAADRFVQANAKAIEACHRQARKARQEVRCTVRVGFFAASQR